VATVREPVGAAGSLINSMYTGAESFGNRVEHALLRDPLLQMLDDYYRVIGRMPRSAGSGGAVVRFDELTSELDSVLANLYDDLGYPKPVDFADHAQQLNDQAARYRSRHRYDLRQFDLDPVQVAERYRFAFDLFGWNRTKT
jgi:hypothetical protein